VALFAGRFHLATNLRLRVAGRAAGLDRDDVQMVIDGVRDERDFAQVCRHYEQETGTKLPAAPPDGSTGADGGFLKQLLEWLSSPEGQAFLKMIFALFGLTI
jgi:hypothetical protein